MRLRTLVLGSALAALPFASCAADGEVSVERGRYIAMIGGCHDCHTANYLQSEGEIDPALALKGTGLGWQGPWGTTYALNLRITAGTRSEDEFVAFIREFRTRPPMPWFNIHTMDESDIRSLHQYILSLGEPGEQVPAALAPGETPTTPYIVVAPPTMP